MQRWEYAAGGLIAVGVGFALLQLSRFVLWSQSTIELFFNTLPFLWIAAAIAYAGYWLLGSEEYGRFAPRIAVWSAGSGLGFAAVGVLVFFGVDLRFEDVLFVLVDVTTAGVLGGVLVGLYDARSRRSFEQIERFAHKLEAIHQYGKVLNESQTIDEVSSLSIEVGEFVLEGDGAAFLYRFDGKFRVLDSTLAPEYDHSVVTETAESVASGEPLTATTDADMEADPSSDERSNLSIAIPISGTDETAALFVLFDSADVSFESETIDLIELLAAHSATALANVNRDVSTQLPSADGQPIE
ncbi:MAG: GAF domain-containing protein [Halobacteriota archaeon]